ncbi:BMP family ABC transporter substrate-binding protein [Lichenihabitans sp. Uapishka_5]|uniref:BMP family ABC transporter substrate-binding protein n=1 Tax=Lichenihabitans sp. Uapishka_5 TaxID=3037302 RepID=UPI0029E7FAB6|nr:BMP family ABC transporter substrate-binding protein [Lichenihabitans sp. Uapishka_5]MDX7950391.1 BMP family ABC transporter substrate-binding protein [Lichenihabitans sp. Uapishka_5]
MDFVLPRRRFLAGAATTTAALALGGPAARAAGGPIKAAWVYVGPVGDFGWSYQHDQGRKAVEKEFGDKVKTSFVEKVAEGPDAERVIRQLAQSNDIVFTTSFGFMNPAERVAKQFPKVKFEQATGYKTAPNFAEYNSRFYQGRAITGAIAGHLSKKGVAGYVGSVPIPEVVMGINAFTLAAQKVNPNFQTKVIWVNGWFDPGKEADAAKSLIDQGADFLCQHTDSPAVVQTAEARGIPAVGQASNMQSFGPKVQVTSIMDNWAPYYIERIKAVMDGTWKTQSVWMGLKEGLVDMAAYGPMVTPEVAAAADKVKAGLMDGSYQAFAGPIKDQKGVEKVSAGKSLTDEELLKLDWYVQGVQA